MNRSTLTFTYGDSRETVTGEIAADLKTWALARATNPVFFVDDFRGVGTWVDSETGLPRSEHSGVIVVQVDSSDVPEIRRRAAMTCWWFDQQAIGLQVHDTATNGDGLVLPYEPIA